MGTETTTGGPQDHAQGTILLFPIDEVICSQLIFLKIILIVVTTNFTYNTYTTTTTYSNCYNTMDISNVTIPKYY